MTHSLSCTEEHGLVGVRRPSVINKNRIDTFNVYWNYCIILEVTVARNGKITAMIR